MKVVLDASVAIASMRPGEPSHAAARMRIERALQGADELVERAIFGVEVAGALARRVTPEADIRELIRALGRAPHRIETIGPKRAALAQNLAIKAGLRGADAIYVWLASSRRLPLCTLDREMAERASAFCKVVVS